MIINHLSRRQFIKITVAIGAGSMILTNNLLAGTEGTGVVPVHNGEALVVSTAEEMEKLIAVAQPGSEIAIAAGIQKDWRVTLSGSGAPGKPIVIRPEKPGLTIMTGTTAFKITGSHIEIRDIMFRDCKMDEENVFTLENTTNCRITNCRFENTQGEARVVVFQGRANDNRLDHCTILNTIGRPVQIRIGDSHLPERNRIDHNLFEEVPPKGGNGRETIQIGQNQPAFGLLEPKTLVEYNVFLRCNGESEIISNKSSRNIYRGNIFLNCEGSLVVRGGSHCLIENNWFRNCSGGVRLHGTHHFVINNTFINLKSTGIVLPFGMQRQLGSLYQATGHCLVAHNTIVNPGEAGIFLGTNHGRDLMNENWNDDKHGNISTLNEAPYQNRIVNNIITSTTGTLLYADSSPDNEISGNLLYAKDKAVQGISGEHALLDDPMFTDPLSDDFSLKPGSLAFEAVLVMIQIPDQPHHPGARGKRPEAGPAY